MNRVRFVVLAGTVVVASAVAVAHSGYAAPQRHAAAQPPSRRPASTTVLPTATVTATRITVPGSISALPDASPAKVTLAPLLPSMDSVDVSMASGATIRAGGLQMSLYLPRGPFFLGELLPVTVWLSNHSAKAVSYLGAPTRDACLPAFQVDLTGGSPPLYTLPAMLHPQCPAPMPRQLGAGQTLTVPLLVPLTASGRVTLTARATFVSITRGSGTLTISSGPGPFITGGWPSTTITVAPHAPADRAIHLLHIGQLDLPFLHINSQVIVDAPRDAASHLLYQSSATCTGRDEGTLPWQPLASTVIQEPGCGSDEKWTIMVSAPGYAIAAGTY